MAVLRASYPKNSVCALSFTSGSRLATLVELGGNLAQINGPKLMTEGTEGPHVSRRFDGQHYGHAH